MGSVKPPFFQFTLALSKTYPNNHENNVSDIPEFKMFSGRMPPRLLQSKFWTPDNKILDQPQTCLPFWVPRYFSPYCTACFLLRVRHGSRYGFLAEVPVIHTSYCYIISATMWLFDKEGRCRCRNCARGGTGGFSTPTFGQLGPYLWFSSQTYPIRNNETLISMAFVKFMMHFQLKFQNLFSGEHAPRSISLLICLHVHVQHPPPPPPHFKTHFAIPEI